MQLAVAIVLALFYVGLTLMWGGLHPGASVPWWLFAPFIVTFCAVGLAWAVSNFLPTPWRNGRRYGLPPRRVRVSWRTAFRISAPVPMLVFLYHLCWGLSLNFEIGWVAFVASALAGMALVFVGHTRQRELRLLRDGDVAVGVVDDRNDIGEGPDRIAYHFTTADGRIVSGHGWDIGYGVVKGTPVPVFYDVDDPEDHVVACGCWLEAD